jgi:hypothetical protein
VQHGVTGRDPETGDEAVPADAGRAFSWRTAALTFAVLRPELFRIVVRTAEVLLPGGEESGLSGAWARTAEDWES